MDLPPTSNFTSSTVFKTVWRWGEGMIWEVGLEIEGWGCGIGLQDAEVEGRCQHAAVPTPLVTSTQQEPIP